jgi:penicillin-binding protein 2
LSDEQVLARLKGLTIVLVILFAIVAARLFQLQIAEKDRYAHLADRNRIRLMPISAPRGLILDRNGEVLVRSRSSFTISVVPGGLTENKEEVLQKLTDILVQQENSGIETVEDVERLIRKGATYPYEPIRLIRDVPAATLLAVEENRWELPGIIVEEIPAREYVYGSLASHVLGYMTVINEEELRRLGKEGYRPTDLVGRSGLEAFYERELRGKDGITQVEVDAHSHVTKEIGRQEPVPGNNIFLTINKKLQENVERVLIEQLAMLQEEESTKDAKSGAVVALDPNNGEILAMVSYPNFDPNRFVGGVSKEYLSYLSGPPSAEENRATRGLFSPGSAFKPFVAIGMLEERITGPGDVWFADGRSQSGKTCWYYREYGLSHGLLTVADALSQSCNDYFWHFGSLLGPERIANYATAFNLGNPTGIDLFPSEKTGIVPTPDWKWRNFSNLDPWDRRWQPAETEDYSIGQGFLLTTPLQMAVAYGGLATSGKIFEPFLVKEIQSPAGDVLYRRNAKLVSELSFREETWDTVQRGLRMVVSEGTARRVFAGSQITFAGKTGSTQVVGGVAHGWFVGWAPAVDPSIVVAVLLEHGGGGALAAPVARQIMEEYLLGNE